MQATIPYEVLGTEIAPLLGRKEECRKIRRNLEKSKPDHISVIGPKYIGKTVFLASIASEFESSSNDRSKSLYWDLRHNSPESDADFYSQFTTRLASIVRTINAQYTDLLREPSYGSIRSVFDLLEHDHGIVICFFDGLDPVLRSTGITKNLWDSLRALGNMSSFRMITGSRKPLRELCLSPESQTSDFFNIFSANAFRLAALDESDTKEFLEPLKERFRDIADDALSCIRGWCGGIPVLTAALCCDLWQESNAAQSLTAKQINEQAAVTYSKETIIDCLYDLFWRDCTEQERVILSEIAQGIKSDRPTKDPIVEALLHRGFVETRDNQLIIPSKFVADFTTREGGSVSSLRNLFGTAEGFAENAGAFLELQLDQLSKVDQTLRSLIATMIRFLYDPIESAKFIRATNDRAYSVVLEKEFPSGKIPPQWIAEWKRQGLSDIWRQKGFPEITDVVPTDRKLRYHLLQLMADTRNRLPGKRVTPDLQLMAAHLKLMGDFGQHPESQRPTQAFMFAICVSAIELARLIATVYP